MTISQQQLGERLRAAREACRLTQDDVARHLGVSRPTVTQIELGNRAVSSIELDKLAYLYGRDIRDFLADEFEEDDALVALFRRHPEVSEDEGLLAPLRECLALGREITTLERLLGVDRDLTALPSYAVSVPSAKWTSVEQGDRLASEERSRLGLGAAPLPNLAELLETQGVRTAQVHLADDVSGCTLFSPDVGVFVVVNRRHHFFRRRFSFAHEYCHVVLDREQEGTVSRASDRDDLIEVRANSFAASFLMPETGVVEFIRGLSKGRPGREHAEIFDEEVAVAAEGRTSAGNQALQLYDVVLLADHFGVSRSAALYRLLNLKLIDRQEFDALVSMDEVKGQHVAKLLDVREPDPVESRNEFRHRFLALGIEALRRGEITRQKLNELAVMVGAPSDLLDVVLADAGIDSETRGVDVVLPGA